MLVKEIEELADEVNGWNVSVDDMKKVIDEME